MEASTLPGWVRPLGEKDVLPAGAEAKKGSLLIADKGTTLISPCISAHAAAMYLSPARDQPRLHPSCCQRGRSLHAHPHASGPMIE